MREVLGTNNFVGLPQIRGLPVAGAPVMAPGTNGATFVNNTNIVAAAAIPFIDINTATIDAAPASSYLVQALDTDFSNIPWSVGQKLYATEDGTGDSIFLGEIAAVSTAGVGGSCPLHFCCSRNCCQSDYSRK